MNKIALIEDNADNRLLIGAMLEDRYEVIEYENGTEAINGLKNLTPDVILLDISLPDIDGTEVLAELQKNSNLKDVPIAALTAHAMVGDREKYIALGFNDYITKPILDEEEFLRRIESLK